MKPQSRLFSSLRDLGAALTLVGALVLAPRAAQAHIKMSLPLDWITTNSLGDPQKITPCGVDPTLPPPVPPTATGAVTTLHVGDKVTFNWTETVRDGHFRISLAINSRDELKDPAVTKKNTNGTAAEVEISTAYPVLADNLFPHTEASVSANKAYTYTVTIPNTPCTKCTLQLLQFMANHPLDPSYFYHQCADVTILAAAGAGGTSGQTGGTGGGGGAAGKPGGTGGTTAGTGGATTGTGGATSGTGGATSGTGGTTTGTGTGGTITGTGGGVATGTGGTGVSSGSGGNAVGSGGSPASGSGGTGEGGSPEGGGSSGGCSCQVGGTNVKLTGLGLLCVALVCVRRRRRARR